MIILTSILTIIFLTLSILHLNWAIGNSWGYDQSIPSNEDGSLPFRPGKISCLIVGLFLALISAFYFINPQEGNPNNWIFDYGRWIIPIIFTIRAIGDFKYAGLTKKIKSTTFAKMDSKYYTPLCILIAALGFIVKFFG